MTRWISVALALLAASAPVAATERRFSVTDFDRIVVEGPYIVRLSTGRATSALARGPQAALDRVSVEVVGQTLRIRRNRQYWGGNPSAQQGPLEIDLVTRALRSARLIGPARLDADRLEGLRVDLIVEGAGTIRATNVAADNLSVGLAGSGRIVIAGTAEAVTADVQGTGDVDGSQLRSENARITTTTTGVITLDVARTADVNALGLGQVTITGRPACTVRGPNADQVRCGQNPLDQRQQR